MSPNLVLFCKVHGDNNVFAYTRVHPALLYLGNLSWEIVL
jgi:hypothetical protein